MFAASLVDELTSYYMKNKVVEKSHAVQQISIQLQLRSEGKLLFHPQDKYVVRFAYSANGKFSNTILSLSKLIKVDNIPVIVCLLKPTSFELLLANTTFINKISHSSHALSLTNIRGSFLGSDISRVYQGLENHINNFERLATLHEEIKQDENLRRIVLATSQIKAIKEKFIVDEKLRKNIHDSIRYSFNAADKFREIKVQLDMRVKELTDSIVTIATLDESNVNIRGNKIEQLITSAENQHGLADYEWQLDDGGRVTVDIKTSLTGKASANPKHYNVDKQLQALSDGRTACLIYFVHIDPLNHKVSTFLVNCFDESVIDSTRIQFHWAGRDSRGVTQLDMKIQNYFTREWRERLNLTRALRFIDDLIDEKLK